MAPFTLPSDFLSGPAPNLQKNNIDFKKTDLPEYDGLYATVLDGVLTNEECKFLVKAAEATTDGKWEQAMINVGNGEQVLITDTRDCGRIIWDDREMVAKIWARCKDHIGEIESLHEVPRVTGWGPCKRKETWRLTRPNERMRFLKYGKGQYFRRKFIVFHQGLLGAATDFSTAHYDGSYATPGDEEITFYTLHLYLNESSPDSEEGPLEGGATTFHSDDMKRSLDVNPKIGRVLIFQHKGLPHSGADVTNGIKMTLRTDLLYAKVSGEPKKF